MLQPKGAEFQAGKVPPSGRDASVWRRARMRLAGIGQRCGWRQVDWWGGGRPEDASGRACGGGTLGDGHDHGSHELTIMGGGVEWMREGGKDQTNFYPFHNQ